MLLKISLFASDVCKEAMRKKVEILICASSSAVLLSANNRLYSLTKASLAASARALNFSAIE